MYVPHNVCIYLAAYAGGLAGIGVAGASTVASDYAYSAQQIDAFAQAVDIAWGVLTAMGA
jgi:hypothetical protein